MTAQVAQDKTVLRYDVLGARRFSNYWWASIISIGGGWFFCWLACLAISTLTFLPVGNAVDLVFVPQGLAMGLYGAAGTLLALYLWLTVVWDLGGGYNEFDKRTGQAKIFRWGFPGKNRQIELNFKLSDVQAVKATLREGISPKRSLYLRVKGMREIPLTRVGQPLALSELENQAAELARFLGVPLEGL
ncbi:MAG: photosystem I assembly protein Ycf4 [Leptolyngbyaceae cyanobacterium CSU_1_3]|nr:photosystem I assembly protein Ycf4 [Leptolyngbyaceae cyanobacterium CSU_1_3]